jgi:hypothetical protein
MKNYPPTAFLNGHPNIAIFYSGYFASKKIDDKNDSLEYVWDIEKLLESENI